MAILLLYQSFTKTLSLLSATWRRCLRHVVDETQYNTVVNAWSFYVVRCVTYVMKSIVLVDDMERWRYGCYEMVGR